MDAMGRAELRERVDYARRQRLARPDNPEPELGLLRAKKQDGEEVLDVPSKGGEVQELIGHIRKAGFKVVRSGSQRHYKVQNPKGVIVTDDNGPLIISTSPSDHRWREMHVQRLMRAGVLKADPYKATGKQSRGPQANGNGAEPEEAPKKTAAEEKKERERAAQADVRDRRSGSAVEGTAKLRARFEPIVPHLGGWAVGAGPRAQLWNTPMRVLTVAELAAVMRHWAVSRGRLELPRDKVTKEPADAKAVEAAARGLKQGSTMSERWQPLVSVFLDDLWRDPSGDKEFHNDPRQAAQRYMHLLREQRGIVEPPAAPKAGEPVRLVAVEDPASAPGAAAPEPVLLGPAYEMAPPVLALKVMHWAGAAGADFGEALDAAMQVAELEFKQQKEEMWKSPESPQTSSGSTLIRSPRGT